MMIQPFVKQLEISDVDGFVKPEYPYCMADVCIETPMLLWF